MSSIPEKLIREKRSFFIRSGSFEKLKCSAKYPLRLIGVKLSKASIVELAETLIARSRLLSQRCLLVLFIIIYKIICAALSILVRTSANPISVVTVSNKEDKKSTLGFYERLQIKVEKLQKHKKRLDSLKSSDEICFQSNNVTNDIIKQSPIITKFQQITTQSSSSTQIPDSTENLRNEKNLNKACIDYEFRAELKRLRQYSTEKEILQQSKSGISGSSVNGSYQLGDLNSNRNLFELICLYPLVYGSILIMLCQIYVLGNVINSTPITLGYVFLIGSLGFIAFITFKVFFIEKFRKVIPNKRKAWDLKITEEQEIVTTNEEIATVGESTTTITTTEITLTRQSRSRLKRNIDLSSKTLSKIKLL